MKLTEKFVKNIKRGISFSLVPVFVTVMSGCGKKNESPTIELTSDLVQVQAVGDVKQLSPISESRLNQLGISGIEEKDLKVHNFDYIVDVKKLGDKCQNKDLCFFESFDKKTISSEKIDEEVGIAEHVHRLDSKLTPVANYILGNEKLLIPDCYSHYFVNSSENRVQEDLKIYKKMKWFYSEKILISNHLSNPLKLIYSRAEVDENVDDLVNNEYYDLHCQTLNEGDVMESYSLYVMSTGGQEETMIGYLQTGAGSDSLNVQDKIFGDLQSVITTVEDASIVEGCDVMSVEEFISLEDNIKDKKITDGVVNESSFSYQKK